jgi:signal peptidase I
MYSDQPALPTPPRRTVKRVLAALVSGLIPGCGQFILGDARRGLPFCAAFLIIAICYLILRLPRSYPGRVCSLLAVWAVAAYASCDAARSRARDGSIRLGRWWFLLFILCAVVTGTIVESRLCIWSGFHTYSIPSESMEPTIRRGEYIFVDSRAYSKARPIPGDLIVYRSGSTQYLKRVAAAPGDTIASRANHVTLNGVSENAPYVHHSGPYNLESARFGPITIPPQKYFVLGDNRDRSLDSRFPQVGLIDESNIVGKPLYIIRGTHGRIGQLLR